MPLAKRKSTEKSISSYFKKEDEKAEKERVAEETARFERQEEAKRSQMMLKEQHEQDGAVQEAPDSAEQE